MGQAIVEPRGLVCRSIVAKLGRQWDCRGRTCSVQTHTGITEGTFFRDQGWLFYQLGRLIERADQTTRLLDIRYHLLVPADSGEELRVAELT